MCLIFLINSELRFAAHIIYVSSIWLDRASTSFVSHAPSISPYHLILHTHLYMPSSSATWTIILIKEHLWVLSAVHLRCKCLCTSYCQETEVVRLHPILFSSWWATLAASSVQIYLQDMPSRLQVSAWCTAPWYLVDQCVPVMVNLVCSNLRSANNHFDIIGPRTWNKLPTDRDPSWWTGLIRMSIIKYTNLLTYT